MGVKVAVPTPVVEVGKAVLERTLVGGGIKVRVAVGRIRVDVFAIVGRRVFIRKGVWVGTPIPMRVRVGVRVSVGGRCVNVGVNVGVKNKGVAVGVGVGKYPFRRTCRQMLSR